MASLDAGGLHQTRDAILAARQSGTNQVTQNPWRPVGAAARFIAGLDSLQQLSILTLARTGWPFKPIVESLVDTPSNRHMVRVGQRFLYLAIKPYFT